jgi:uncharacterized protein (TIGR03437 family)
MANARIRKIGLDGNITLVAGTGKDGFDGDGKAAVNASLNYPAGLAVDASGNLYVADRYNQRIRRITTDGIINTIAGNGTVGSSGDNGLALSASLGYPNGIAIDGQGRVLVADTLNGRIRRFIPGGAISTIAGTLPGFSGDGSFATSAALNGPQGVAVDSKGVIYVSDFGNQRIRAISTTGMITTIAGSIAGFAGDNGTSFNALLNGPQLLATDLQGNLYIADTLNSRIRMITPARTISTVAGSGHTGANSGPAISAVLSSPTGVAMDSTGNLYVADTDNNLVRKIDTAGKMTIIAGTGIYGYSGDGGIATSAQLERPQGLAVDSIGNVYVTDGDSNTVRMITPGGTITKVAGAGMAWGDGGPALDSRLNFPHGIAVDAKGVIYIADTANNRVRRITPDGMMSTFIGDGTANSTGDGGLASAAQVNQPYDVQVGPDGTVYISEFYGRRVRAVAPNGIVRTVGTLPSYPYGMALDASGNILISTYNQVVTLSAAGVVQPIAGGGIGFGGDGGLALSALLEGPIGLTTDTKGNIYFCDQGNNRIRKLTPDVVSQVVSAGGDQQSGSVGTLLPIPLTVLVNGSTGAPYPGVQVNFAITSGGGILSAKQTLTGPDGKAGVTLTPTTSGTITVAATVAGLSPVVFTATSVNTMAAISILSGNNQSAAAGSALPQVLAVTVTGVDQRPFAGALVTFAVTAGSATLNPASMSTGKDGSAYTQVTLGPAAGTVTITASVAGLPPATFSVTAMAANAPQIFAGGVVTAGLSVPPVQVVSPNAIVSIFGSNFAPPGTSRKVSGADLVNDMVPTNLAGVCVTFGTTRAPVFLVTPGQLNVQVPQVAVPGTPPVQVITNCDAPNAVASGSVNVAVQAASPEFFYAANDGSGKSPVAATDGLSGAGVGDPARLGAGFARAYPGETVTIYATGLGLTSPSFATGQLPPAGAQVGNVSISIDGTPLDPSAIQYAGVTPLNAGLYQLNIVLPATLTTGDHGITMSVGGTRSPAGGYISVR